MVRLTHSLTTIIGTLLFLDAEYTCATFVVSFSTLFADHILTTGALSGACFATDALKHQSTASTLFRVVLSF